MTALMMPHLSYCGIVAQKQRCCFWCRRCRRERINYYLIKCNHACMHACMQTNGTLVHLAFGCCGCCRCCWHNCIYLVQCLFCVQLIKENSLQALVCVPGLPLLLHGIVVKIDVAEQLWDLQTLDEQSVAFLFLFKGVLNFLKSALFANASLGIERDGRFHGGR